MTEHKLQCFGESGNSDKPALMLELAGAGWEPVFVDVFNGAARTPEYRHEPRWTHPCALMQRGRPADEAA